MMVCTRINGRVAVFHSSETDPEAARKQVLDALLKDRAWRADRRAVLAVVKPHIPHPDDLVEVPEAA